VADEASQDVLARSIRRPRRPSPFGNPRVCAFVVQVFHIARLASLKCDFVHAKRHCLDLLHIGASRRDSGEQRCDVVPRRVAVFTTSLDGNGYREVVAAVFLRRIRN
jgi:hypothetical protein